MSIRQHPVQEKAVASCGIVDQHMCYGADDPAVLDHQAAAQVDLGDAALGAQTLKGRVASLGSEWLDDEEIKKVNDRYMPEMVKQIGDMAKKVGGHGGMDFLMTWRLIDCLRNGLPMDIDVYDAATWSVIIPLSEKSLSNRSGSVDIPDFTQGAWQTNRPVNITLSEGNTTTVRL